MKKLYFAGVALALGLGAFWVLSEQNDTQKNSEREAYRKLLKDHPFSNRPRLESEDMGEKEEEGEAATPDLAWEQDFLRTMNPALGRPTPEVLVDIMENIKKGGGAGYGLAPGAAQSPWEERGPNNVGGRTRGLVWDPNSQTGNKVWAGGVNGGLWYNNDITSSASSWIKVNDFWSNIAITCIAFDPVNTQVMYVGTGEGYTAGGSSGVRGGGIFKSTDGGATWNVLASSSSFYWVNDIVVRDEGGNEGVVYAAVDGRYYAGSYHGMSAAGIRRSTNGGTTFPNVSPNVPSQTIKFIPSDLEIGPNNRLWCGTKASSYSSSDRGGGYILSSDDGTTWNVENSHSVSNGYGRMAIACAPSDSNVVYAIVESSNQCEAIIRTTNYGSSWTTRNEPADADNGIPNGDFTRGQAWYDLVIAVDPNDADVAIAGGIDLFRTTDGANNWTQISKWSNNNNLSNLSCSYVHADQHAIRFKQGSSSTIIFGNDGGVFYSSNITTAGSNDVIDERNNNYNVTQYYACAIHPTAGSNIFLAGAQDNGSQRYSSAGINSTTRVYGGDGAFCFIDQSDANVAIVSYVYNRYYKSTNSGSSFPSTLIDDGNTGKFINPADYHDADNVLYSGKGTGSIWRVRNVTGSPSAEETINVTGMSDDASHIRCSPYSSTVFVGSDVGEIFKITDANGTYSVTDITGSNLPSGAVSCIEIGASDNELLATYFNYGVTSVWYSDNGGSSWVSKEGNLPDMPVRWALFNPNNRNEVILATDLGVWSCDDISVSSPVWASSSTGLANTRVDMLQIRASDQMVIAATHGRGLFSSDAFAAQSPAPDFTVNTTTTCAPQKVYFTDLSVHDPNAWKWSFSPSTVVYEDGTGDTSQNPVVRFSNPGTYQVSLEASNALGANVEVKAGYITVTAANVPTVVITPNANPSCTGQSISFTSVVTNEGTTPTYQWKVNGANVGSNSPNFSSAGLLDGDTVACELTSNDSCAYSTPVKSNEVIMQMQAGPTVTLFLADPNACINEDPFDLAGGLPAGGTYTGNSVINNQFDPVLAGFGAHTITYTYTNSNGCTNSATDVITVSNLPQKPEIQRTAGTNSLQSSITAAFYEWTVDGVVIPSAINRNLTMTKSGTYVVKVTNGFECSNTSEPLDAFMVGIPGTEEFIKASIYPNPNKGQFVLALDLTEAMDLQLQVFDASGKEVHTELLQLQAGKAEKNLSLALAPGTYYVRLANETYELKKQIVIQP